MKSLEMGRMGSTAMYLLDSMDCNPSFFQGVQAMVCTATCCGHH